MRAAILGSPLRYRSVYKCSEMLQNKHTQLREKILDSLLKRQLGTTAQACNVSIRKLTQEACCK